MCNIRDPGMTWKVVSLFFSRIYPPEHFKKKYALDDVGFTDEVSVCVCTAL